VAVSAVEVARFRAGNLEISRLADRDLRALWRSLDLGSPRGARNALLSNVPVLTDMYGEQSAALAAEWYDDMRAAERVPGRYRARMASTVPADYVRQRVRYGAGHLFTATPELMLPFLSTAISEYVLQPGRDTIQRSSIEDPDAAGWHRETRPTETYADGCGFCQMLAGRGGVYKWETAPFAAHGNCNCVAVPSWDHDAEEVPVSAYIASARTAGLSEAQRAERNRTIRDWIAINQP